MTTPAVTRASAMEILRANVTVGRARAGFSQEDLAQRSKVGRATISRIERGSARDVGVETLERIAIALGVAIADLFVPSRDDRVDDDELAARAASNDSEFIDARTLLAAVDQAAGRPAERYSRAGRPPVARQNSP
ncbi:MAG: hypothetical protein NVS2B17_32660 [Candidatus Velthaea sp.]